MKNIDYHCSLNFQMIFYFIEILNVSSTLEQSQTKYNKRHCAFMLESTQLIRWTSLWFSKEDPVFDKTARQWLWPRFARFTKVEENAMKQFPNYFNSRSSFHKLITEWNTRKRAKTVINDLLLCGIFYSHFWVHFWPNYFGKFSCFEKQLSVSLLWS